MDILGHDMYADPFILFNFLSIAAGLGVFIFYTWRTRQKISYTKFLALLVLFMGLSYTALLVKLMFGFNFSPFIVLFGPPLFFIYFHSRLYQSTSPHLFYHFIPAGLYLVYLAVVNIFYSDQSYCFTCYLSEACLVFICLYFVLALIEFQRAKQMHVEMRTLEVIKKMLLPNIIFLAALILMFFSFRANSFDYLFLYYLSLVIYFTSYALIKDFILAHLNQKKKYTKTALDDHVKQHILRKIEDKIQNEKYFISNSASLPDLAKSIGSTPNVVSQVINECLRKNFFDLMASQRIEEAKRIIETEYPELSIDGIAEQVGYNSKSAFYNAFKKNVGSTPAEYRQRVRKVN